jgi:hypothetical protein
MPTRPEPVSEQPEFTGTMKGEVLVFLTTNKFRIQLNDCQIVDAVMPDALLEVVRPWYEDRANGPDHIRVTVRFREAPAMHVISTVGSSAWCGVRRANRR